MEFMCFDWKRFIDSNIVDVDWDNFELKKDRKGNWKSEEESIAIEVRKTNLKGILLARQFEFRPEKKGYVYTKEDSRHDWTEHNLHLREDNLNKDIFKKLLYYVIETPPLPEKRIEQLEKIKKDFYVGYMAEHSKDFFDKDDTFTQSNGPPLPFCDS
eukprot:m.166968 g.166968  ORF g.166968 m.166968 type:complete len:157 (+) comp13459_c0_seq1:1942-2412(+)